MQKEESVMKKNNYYIWIITFLCALLFLLFNSKCSPLYVMNNWWDASALFTVGRSMKHGKILYMDVYEHKGIYYCLLHMFAAMITEKSYIGIFIFEVISFWVFLIFAYKIWCLINDDVKIINIPIITFLIMTSTMFMYGDSVEEFCLPIYIVAIFIITKWIKNDFNRTRINWIVLGILTAVVFWSKYTLCMFL